MRFPFPWREGRGEGEEIDQLGEKAVHWSFLCYGFFPFSTIS